MLVEFASVVDALRCAVEVQREMAEHNATVPADKRIEFRIGINVGDVVVEDGDIFGDGVNVAARLEGLADPGGICISARVQEDVAGRLDLTFEDIGERQLRNIARPVRVFRVPIAASAAAKAPLALPDKPSLAVLPFQNLSGDPEQEYFVDGVVEEISRRSRACRGCSSSRAIRALRTRASRRICAKSGASSACATCSKAVCAKREIVCASPAS